MRTIKEALEDGSLSLEDEIDYADMTEEEYKKEIERLNNIINELEKSIDNKLKEFEDNKDYFIDETTLKDLKNELQELKGVDKE